MATSEATGLVRQLRRVVATQDAAGETDGELLGLFVDRRDCAAFEALFRRHGPMVIGATP